MGRLDEAAKHKVVELRKAGLSFRKIKAVLELENIKVSAQAIYLFLREFQGRPPGRVRPLEAGSSTSLGQVQARAIGVQEKWSGVHMQNLICDPSQQSGFIAKATNSSSTKPPGSTEACSSISSISGRRQSQGDKEEKDIQIVSVTSLAQSSQSGLQASMARTETSVASSSGATTAALSRRRVSPSPVITSMLAARRRLLDKAVSHRLKSFQQVASLVMRDPASVQGADLRNTVQQPSETYASNERTVMGSQSEGIGGTSARRVSIQRPSLSLRSLHLPPRIGIRLPNQPPSPLATSVPGSSALRLPSPQSIQTTNLNEGNSNPQQTIQDSRVRGLQDQIQTLSSEVHSLGVAVKMLVEQQCHLEREQVQQTNIQKQILSTLQSMSSKLGCCSTVQSQHNKTPSPAASESTSFNQDSFNCSQGTYTQCSQTQPSFNSLEVLETVEAFKLPELSPSSMNGFAACSSAESLPLVQTPPQTQTYGALYQPQNSQTHMPGFTQNYVSAYNQSNNATFRGPASKMSDFSNSCTVRSLQDCSISTPPVLSSSVSLQEQRNIIKVEGP